MADAFGVLSTAALLISAIAFQLILAINADIASSMFIYWGGANHSMIQGDDLQLVLDQISGSGVQSKSNYLFGSFEMQMKLVPGNSAGTVTAFYLSSNGVNHDEIDFEFLGNVTGKPYIIHTNIFTQGGGGREVQYYPWFDPTADYHNYTIHWNPNAVVWYVDGIPIRVYRNYTSEGIAFPNQQGMHAYSSIWNAEDWATRAGLDKIEWSNAPFVAKLRNFRSSGCPLKAPENIRQCVTPLETNTGAFSRLSDAKAGQMDWVRRNYIVYDYCKDVKKFKRGLPGECFLPQH
ncbi:unnamed protein product [Cuscuta campestris]|uniref:Xyloglucan endotransglucosylase/hydrolase n=1 Tax=Cuscuta campestris TaxID=132261 RepID=A0A484KJ71_9ASTE|nr:unnamed protein product [Cuscuta campestris]